MYVWNKQTQNQRLGGLFMKRSIDIFAGQTLKRLIWIIKNLIARVSRYPFRQSSSLRRVVPFLSELKLASVRVNLTHLQESSFPFLAFYYVLHVYQFQPRYPGPFTGSSSVAIFYGLVAIATFIYFDGLEWSLYSIWILLSKQQLFAQYFTLVVKAMSISL